MCRRWRVYGLLLPLGTAAMPQLAAEWVCSYLLLRVGNWRRSLFPLWMQALPNLWGSPLLENMYEYPPSILSRRIDVDR